MQPDDNNKTSVFRNELKSKGIKAVVRHKSNEKKRTDKSYKFDVRLY